MDQQRQKAFQKLRPSCIELSSIALKFKGHHAAIKDVLRALEEQNGILTTLGQQNQLDEKLAEYSFFPLTHVFNDSQRLSPRCMQVAVETVNILVSQGWRQKVAPEMGKQLLILMSLIAGGDPRRQSLPPTEELKIAGFKCVETITFWLAHSAAGRAVFDDQGTRNIVDQLAYLLLDGLTNSVSEEVQVSAASALLELYNSVSSRLFLATLLPRTVSSLTKALRPSTQFRRIRNVLVMNLKVLGVILNKTLADKNHFRDNQEQAEKEALDETWLKATTSQVKNALAQVCKLRTHDQMVVRNALYELCITLVEDCSRTLQESLPILTETLVVLTGNIDDPLAVIRLRNLMLYRPDIVNILQSSYYDWSQTLPRVMQGNDDGPKVLMLDRITNTFNLLSETTSNTENLVKILGSTILKSITNVAEMGITKRIQSSTSEPNGYMSLVQQHPIHNRQAFEPILFNHQSQKESGSKMQQLINDTQQHRFAGSIMRNVVDSIPDFAPEQRIAPVWLAVQLLQKQSDSPLQLDDIMELTDSSSDRKHSRAYLIQDLYAQTKETLLDSSPSNPYGKMDYRIVALSLESTVLQAQQLGRAYRTELYETLYPILALLSSQNSLVRNHAITALNCLATLCEYDSVSALLIENVDYLVNSIAWKLNTFNLSPEAPGVLNMVLRLVGANVIPYLDDLIISIFAALDSFHGYPQWVEMLFGVLQTLVDESARRPELAITNGHSTVVHKKATYPTATVDDIISDLRSRKRRKLESRKSTRIDEQEFAPHRPWTRERDDPNYKPDPTEGKDIETLLREAETADEENDLPAPKEPEDEDPTKPLSKSHDLLLKIAQATVPHLSSPSPRVRQILLQLLGQISPLLARHENTFLPLVNSVWPGIVQRLFADIDASVSEARQQSPEAETAYNVTAAADVVTSLCENAGDFMSTRIERIFAQLKPMYMRMYKEVEGQIARKQDRDSTRTGSLIEDTAGTAIRGVVDLQVVKTDSEVSTAKTNNLTTTSSALSSVSRTSIGQVFHSLVRLLVAVLGHVRVSGENADEIFNMLAPLMGYPGTVGETVNEALETYNPDAVWAMRCRKTGQDEIKKGTRAPNDRVWRGIEMPSLKETLRMEGINLQPIVF